MYFFIKKAVWFDIFPSVEFWAIVTGKLTRPLSGYGSFFKPWLFSNGINASKKKNIEPPLPQVSGAGLLNQNNVNIFHVRA